MTDNLQNKFSNTEQLLTTQHDELMQALDTLANALTTAPGNQITALEAINTTLLDIYSRLGQMQLADAAYYLASGNMLSSINTKLDALTDIATALATMNTNIEAIQADNAVFFGNALNYLDLSATTLETMLSNNSINTQYLLRAIAANDPCRSCDAPGYTLPPIGITPTTIDTVHCQRMQALIYALERFLVKLDILSSFGVGFSITVIQDALNEVITELANPTALVLPSALEIADLVAAMVTFVASNILTGDELIAPFQTLHDTLLFALYNADSADVGRSVYRTAIENADLPTTTKRVYKAIGYTALFNLYYDQSQSLNLAGYDGSICAPESTNCTTFYDSTWGPEHYTVLHADPNTYVHARATGTGLRLTITRPNQAQLEVWSPFDDTWATPNGGTFEFLEGGGTGGNLFYEQCEAS